MADTPHRPVAVSERNGQPITLYLPRGSFTKHFSAVISIQPHKPEGGGKKGVADEKAKDRKAKPLRSLQVRERDNGRRYRHRRDML